MNLFTRWGKFNLVGAAGMAVQLTSLALLNRALHGHYLLASSLALELTLLHNFAGHLHFTWRDRQRSGSWIHQLLRFHLANGSISMLGNLVLMPLFVGHLHLPVLAANVAVIAVCSTANFSLGYRWVFAGRLNADAPRELGASA